MADIAIPSLSLDPNVNIRNAYYQPSALQSTIPQKGNFGDFLSNLTQVAKTGIDIYNTIKGNSAQPKVLQSTLEPINFRVTQQAPATPQTGQQPVIPSSNTTIITSPAGSQGTQAVQASGNMGTILIIGAVLVLLVILIARR